jgi:hypothetical protein
MREFNVRIMTRRSQRTVAVLLLLFWLGGSVAAHAETVTSGNKPMPVLDSNLNGKTRLIDVYDAVIAMMRSNYAIYTGLLEQALIVAEDGSDSQYIHQLAESSFFFNNVAGFNQRVPDGLPPEVLGTVFRIKIYKGGVQTQEGTMTLARITETRADGSTYSVERLVGCGHCFDSSVDSGTTYQLEGMSNAGVIGTFSLDAAEIARVNKQLASGLTRANYDFVALDAPSTITSHPDVVRARSLNLLPTVNGDMADQIAPDVPLFSPGYSRAYNTEDQLSSLEEGVVQMRSTFGVGRVQPNTLVT